MEPEINLKDIVKKIERTQKLLTKHSKSLSELKKYLEDNCSHEDTVEIPEYFEGTYYDKASTTIRTRCVVCNKLLHVKEVSHDWYG